MERNSSRRSLRYTLLCVGALLVAVGAWSLTKLGAFTLDPMSGYVASAHGTAISPSDNPIAVVNGGEASALTRIERIDVGSDNFFAVIKVAGVEDDDTANFDVIVQRASNNYCSALHVSNGAIWQGVLRKDLYEVVGVSCPGTAYEIVGYNLTLSPERSDLSLSVARRASWLLSVSDALDGSPVARGVTVDAIGRDIQFDGVARVTQVPVEAPGTTGIYQVSAPGYQAKEVRHHASQGDVNLLMWPTGTMNISRQERCRLTIWRQGADELVYDDAHLQEGITRVDSGAGAFEVTAAWECGVTSMPIVIRPGEDAYFDIEQPMPVPVEIHLTGHLAGNLIEQATATFYASIADGKPVARESWYQCWREVCSSKLADWHVELSGEHYVLAIQLLPGHYTTALSLLGCQTRFDVIAGHSNVVSLAAYDIVPTTVEFDGWGEEQWPIELSWRYIGDTVAVTGMTCRSGESVEVMFLRQPLEVVAIGRRFASSLPVRFDPGAKNDFQLRLRPNAGDCMVDLLLTREGLPAHLQGQISFGVEPLDHDGALASWGWNLDHPSTLYAKFTKPGVYRARGTLRSSVVFSQILHVTAGRSLAVVLVD